MIYTEIYVPPTAPAHYLITGLTRCSRYCTPTPPHGNLRSCTSECTGGALIRGRAAYVCMGGAALLSPPPAGVPTRPHLAPSSSPRPLLSYCSGGPTRPHPRRSLRTLPSTPAQSRSVGKGGGQPNPSAEQVSRGGGIRGGATQPQCRAGQSGGWGGVGRGRQQPNPSAEQVSLQAGKPTPAQSSRSWQTSWSVGMQDGGGQGDASPTPRHPHT